MEIADQSASQLPEMPTAGTQDKLGKLALAHDERMPSYGLLGALAGAVFGSIIQASFPAALQG